MSEASRAATSSAQDATWNLNGTGDFDTGSNWTPNTVPTGTASFGVSNQNSVSFSTATIVGGWTFTAGSSNYTFNDGVPLYVDLPAAVELNVSSTDPGLQGDRSTGGTKPAKLETGAEIAVPLFISTGEKIKVDTRTGAYLGRA